MRSSDWYDGYDAGMADAKSGREGGLVWFCLLAPVVFFVGAQLLGAILR